MPFANEETTAEVALLDTIATAEADVAEQIRLLTLRKDELQVELGGVRESLEALYESKSTLAGLRTEAEADAVEAEAEAAEVEAEAAEAGQEQDWPEPSGGDGVPLAADAAPKITMEDPKKGLSAKSATTPTKIPVAWGFEQTCSHGQTHRAPVACTALGFSSPSLGPPLLRG